MTNSTRFRASSLVISLAMCVLTVLLLMKRSSAISALVFGVEQQRNSG